MAISAFHRFLRIAGVFSALTLSLFCGFASAAMPHPLFKAQAIGSTPDTLEVFALYVQFADETIIGDDGNTTGRGLFGTDSKDTLHLDPNTTPLTRSTRFYLEKHFEFARNYFDKVSDGRVVILPRLFPKPDANDRISPYPLSRRMASYNKASKDAKQKTADFESERAQGLMSFVADAIDKADSASSDSTLNPFKVARREALQNPSSHHYRVFMIFHAGYSRLIDGGSLGPAGANTPSDFTDFFVTKPDFHILDSATTSFTPTGTPSTLRKDSLGVRVSSGDTISQIMMLSESANQDGVNWGINGILVNQLGRAMGMPDLFDIVQGISQVGYFDVMDFAGYNTLNGFLPVFPSAWTRAFMGWDDPVVVRPGAGAFSETNIYAADQPGVNRTRTVKIPLNSQEYLLVENRQRAARDDDVTIFYSQPSGPTDPKFSTQSSVTVKYAFLDSLFLDSLCDDSKCAKKHPNSKKPKGIITGASHYDLGLPGSGLLVWHVNEWFIQSFIKDGFVNAYLGDTLRSQYKGLELVEADGIPSIGKQFTDALGQPSFDYGTAEDVLPHVFRKRKNPPKDTTWASPDTLSTIGSYGFANTNSWNDGRTHIKLVAPLPAQPLFARSIGGFTGDSVFTLRDSALTLRVYWPNDSSFARPSGSIWPVRTAAAGNPQAINILHAANGAGPYVISTSDTGLLQTYDAGGKLALAPRATVGDSAHYDSATSILSTGNTRPQDTASVNSIVDPAGSPIGACVAKDSVLAVLTSRSLRLIHPNSDSLNGSSRSGGRSDSIPVKGAVGPMAWGSKIFIVDSQSVLRSYDFNGVPKDVVPLPVRAYHALAGLHFHGADSQVVVAGVNGSAIQVDLATPQAIDLKPQWKDSISSSETFSVVTSDFDRDSSDDVFLLGSKGDALLFHTRSDKRGLAFAGFPQRFTRSVEQLLDSAGHAYKDTTGHTYFTEDRSSPALADLNGDGHPDILFSGTNSVYAIDWHGAWLPGWPFLPHQHQDIGFTYANHRYPATVIGSTPLVLSLRQKPTVLLGSPDGLIYAVDNTAKPLTYSSYTPDQNSSTGVLMKNLSDWPLSMGGLTLDSTRSPYIHLSLARIDSTTSDLQLLAQSAAGSLSAWSLRSSLAKPGQNWLMPGADAGRSFHFEASTLTAPAAPQDLESIQEFHLFPSPVRNGFATVHLKIGAAASSARVRVFTLVGHPVADLSFTNLTEGLQPFDHILDLGRLGPDVYSVLCEVSFADGKKSSKWERVGVVK